MSIIYVNDDNFECEVINCPSPVLVDFSQNFCAPCEALAPELQMYSDEHPEIKVCTVEDGMAPYAASVFGVRMFPTLVVISKGKRIGFTIGALKKDEIAEFVESAIKGASR